MNAILVAKALEKVLNPAVLINLVSRRVHQLNSGGGRPLLANVGNLSAADIALTEIIEEKMGWEMPEFVALTRPTGKGRNRPQNWAKLASAAWAMGTAAKTKQPKHAEAAV